MAGIPQVITEDRASGAQVIDGSLKFDSGKSTHLQRTQVGGTRKTFTWSGWIKRTDFYNGSNHHDWFSASEGDTTSGGDYGFGLRFSYNKSHGTHPHQIMIFEYENSAFKLRLISDQVFRDFDNFYHMVIAVDTTIASPSSDRVKVYVNGERITAWKSGYEQYPNQNLDLTVNESGKTSQIGCSVDESGVVQQADGYASNFYLIDGQQLGPEEFGFTDGLTGTWRPKNYNKSGPNNGTTWSNSGSSSASLQNGNWGQAFDGTQYMYSGSGPSNGPALADGSITFAPSGLKGRVITAGVRGGSNKTYTVNGQAMTFGSSSAEVATIDLGSIQSITSVVGTSTNSGAWAQFFWIAVDGVLLVDGLNDLKAFGKNGFYLPMDGNTPIGKDQSGNGNDFTPINFGGSVELSKATGAIPILNTNEAGTVAQPGARTDSKTYTVTASGGNYYIDGALKPTLNAYRGGSYTFDYTGATSHPLYLSSLPDGKHNSKAYSVQFGGSDYLSVPDSNDFDLAGNDWTIEAFVYHSSTNYASYEGIVAQWVLGSGTARTWTLETVGSGATSDLEFYYVDSNNNQIGPVQGGTLTKNKWHHVAACRSGNTIRMFVDGVMYGSGTTINVDIKNSTDPLWIGRVVDGYWNGEISNVRVVNGTALYTTNFTPPSTTLTNVTNTKLLCCQDSDATTGAVLPSGSAITVNGSAAATNSRNPFLYNISGSYGVDTIGTSNATKITIPHTAADTLYYYCNIHSGMGSSINVTTDIFKADPYAWKCVYAVPLNGTASDESASLNVNSATKAITTTGASSSLIRNFYGGSFNFSSGNSQYLTTADSDDFDFGNGDFTIEAFVEGPFPSSRTNSVVLNQSVSGASSNSAFYFGCGNDGVSLYLSTSGNSWTNNIEHSQILGNRGWHHIVWQRRSNTLEIYVDGIRVRTGSFSGTISNSSRVVEIGRQSTSGSYFNGRIQDVRVYKGVAKYTENFVVGSTAPDVLPDTPSGISGKSKLTKITEGAVAFDGGDFLQIPASEDLNVGSADFTAEAWVYPTTYGEIVGAFNLNGPYNGWLWSLSFGSLGKQMIWFDGNQQESTSVVPKNKWSHIAFSKSGSTVKYFLDGKLDGSFTASADSTWSNQVVHIGADSNSLTSPGRNFHGFISNLRLIKGTALYTSDFTPPKEPLTEVTNTKLLCCQSTTSATAAAVTPAAFTPRTGGYRFTTAKVYSSYGGGARAANYTVQWSDDNSSWTNAWSGNMSNNSSCGLQQGTGSGNPGAHRYWRYVEGGATTGHHPRVSRIVLSDGTTDVNIKVYVADNCSDNGDYQIGTTSTYEDTTWTAGINSDAAATNFNPFTDDINTIRGQESGYATLNPLKKTTNQTLSDGNLKCSQPSNVWGCAASTIQMYENTGKFYFECTIEATNYTYIGIANRDALIFDLTSVPTGRAYFGGTDNSWGLLSSSGSIVHNTASILTHGAALSAGETVGMTFDTSNKECKWYVEGMLYYTLTLDGNYPFVFGSGSYQSSNTVNFGQKPFKFPPPDGFQPLNLSTVQPEKVIARPDQYVQANIWSGDNTTRNFDIGMKPDFVWIKCRSDAAGHRIFDSVRGPRNSLRTSSTNGQDTVSNFGYVSSFNNNGFTLTPGGYTGYESGDVNMTGRTYVGWTWKAGGSSNTFNIDDVGYANASDVNMNVGALNSAFYNQSQVWSNSSSDPNSVKHSGNADQLFNGNLSSGGVVLHQRATSNTAYYVALDGVSISCSNSVACWMANGASTATMRINGDDNLKVAATSTTNSWVTLNFTGTITKIELGYLDGSGSSNTYYGIRVDEKELIDQGLTVTNVPSIAATGCSVGTKQGFSIVKFTGNSTTTGSISHGLNKKPQFVIVKDLVNGDDWQIKVIDSNLYLKLNGTDSGSTSYSNYTATDSVINLGYTWNNDSSSHIAYSWHDVPGLQKFGTFVGNGSEGTFIELGFRPAIILMKNTTRNDGPWLIHDSARYPQNPSIYTMEPHTTDTEASSPTSRKIDILSNGFKTRGSSVAINESGSTIFYAAWAEAPSINLYGAQSNAR